MLPRAPGCVPPRSTLVSPPRRSPWAVLLGGPPTAPEPPLNCNTTPPAAARDGRHQPRSELAGRVLWLKLPASQHNRQDRRRPRHPARLDLRYAAFRCPASLALYRHIPPISPYRALWSDSRISSLFLVGARLEPAYAALATPLLPRIVYRYAGPPAGGEGMAWGQNKIRFRVSARTCMGMDTGTVGGIASRHSVARPTCSGHRPSTELSATAWPHRPSAVRAHFPPTSMLMQPPTHPTRVPLCRRTHRHALLPSRRGRGWVRQTAHRHQVDRELDQDARQRDKRADAAVRVHDGEQSAPFCPPFPPPTATPAAHKPIPRTTTAAG